MKNKAKKTVVGAMKKETANEMTNFAGKVCEIYKRWKRVNVADGQCFKKDEGKLGLSSTTKRESERNIMEKIMMKKTIGIR